MYVWREIYIYMYAHVHIWLAQPSRFFSRLRLLILLYPLAIKHDNRRKKTVGDWGLPKNQVPLKIFWLIIIFRILKKKTLGLLLSSFHPGVRTFQAFTVSHPLDEQTWQLKSL